MKHRLPVLDDALQNARSLYDERHLAAIRDGLSRARRFTFDEAASRHLGRFIAECGDLIVRNRHSALLPANPLYVEFDIDEMLRALGHASTHDSMPSTERDKTIGFLVVGKRIYEAVRGVSGARAMITHISVAMDTPGATADDAPNATERDGWKRLAFLLGTNVHDLEGEEDRQEIVGSNRIDCIMRGRPHLRELDAGMNGFLRNLWATVLLLNQRRNVSFVDVPAKSAIVLGKRRVQPRHSLIRFDLGSHETARSGYLEGKRETPIRHPVIGHFAHRNLAEGCEHEWPAVPDERMHWRCLHCAGLRWWRNEFDRGDASKGYRSKEHRVTATA